MREQLLILRMYRKKQLIQILKVIQSSRSPDLHCNQLVGIPRSWKEMRLLFRGRKLLHLFPENFPIHVHLPTVLQLHI